MKAAVSVVNFVRKPCFLQALSQCEAYKTGSNDNYRLGGGGGGGGGSPGSHGEHDVSSNDRLQAQSHECLSTYKCLEPMSLYGLSALLSQLASCPSSRLG